MTKIDEVKCFDYSFRQALLSFNNKEYKHSKIHMQNAMRSLDELQDIQNKKDSIYETEKLLEEVARDPEKLKILKRVIEAYE
ncbi:MAG TPA: hypothetical protein VK042_01855 [Atopostipes sp.]|nr:hypothetical protein [Atopostipes sp.]